MKNTDVPCKAVCGLQYLMKEICKCACAAFQLIKAVSPSFLNMAFSRSLKNVDVYQHCRTEKSNNLLRITISYCWLHGLTGEIETIQGGQDIVRGFIKRRLAY